MIFYPIMHAVSLDGKKYLSIVVLLEKAAIQITMDIGLDFLVTLYFAVVHDYCLITA